MAALQFMIFMQLFSMYAAPRGFGHPGIPGVKPGIEEFSSNFCPGMETILSDDCRTRLECTLNGTTKLFNCPQKDLLLRENQCVTHTYYGCRYTSEDRSRRCLETHSTLISDSKFCHLYYDCKNPAESKVCPYPQLFSDVSNECKDFKYVDCGSRIELKSPCHYNPQPCNTTCVPCEVDHPSCDGYRDGMFPHSIRTGSPFYMQCEGQRFVKQGMCSIEIFASKECNQMYYDMLCRNKTDGFYPAPKCGWYRWCVGGRPYEILCPLGTVFDEKRRSCQHIYDTCKPCGRKSC